MLNLFKKKDIPQTFEDAIKKIDELLSKEPADFMKKILSDEQTFVGMLHSTLGRYIRNEWGLWTQEGELYNFFINSGLKHADDMSGLILTSYFRQKNNLPIKMTEEIKRYQKYWEDMDNALKTNGTFIVKI